MSTSLDNVVIHNRYRLGSRIGDGGCAVVYEAFDQIRGDRRVALKFERAVNSGSLLAREFAALYRINSPHIVRGIELFRLSPSLLVPGAVAGGLCLAMEFVSGVESSAWAAGRLVSEVAVVGAQVAAALAGLHAVGVRHGDITPANILISGGSKPHATLVDFGFSAGADGATGTIAAHHSGVGTPRFMAPEALAGSGGASADVYSLGMTLAYLLQPTDLPLGLGVELGDDGVGATYGGLLAALTRSDATARPQPRTVFDRLLEYTGEDARESLSAYRLRGLLMGGLPLGQDDVFGRLEREFIVPETLNGTTTRAVVGSRGAGRSTFMAHAVATAVFHGWDVPFGLRAAGNGGLDEIAALIGELGGEPFLANTVLLGSAGGEALELRGNIFRFFLSASAALRSALKKRHSAAPVAVFWDDVPPGSPLGHFGLFLRNLGDRGPSLFWVQSGLRALGGLAGVEILQLLPLRESEVSRLCARALPLCEIDARLTAEVFRRSAGLPGHAMELLIGRPDLAPASLKPRDLGVAPSDIKQPLDFILRLPQSLRLVLRILALSGAPLTISRASALFSRGSTLQSSNGPKDLSFNDAVAEGERLGLIAIAAHRGLGEAVMFVTRSGYNGPLSSSASDDLARVVAEGLEEAIATLGEKSNAAQRAAGYDTKYGGGWLAAIGALWIRLGERDRAMGPLRAAASLARRDLRLNQALQLFDQLARLARPGSAPHQSALCSAGYLALALGQNKAAQRRFASAGNHKDGVLGEARALVATGDYARAANRLADFAEPTAHPTLTTLRCRCLLLAGDLDGCQTALLILKQAGTSSSSQSRFEPATQSSHLHALDVSADDSPATTRAQIELRGIEGLLRFYRGDSKAATELLEEALHQAAQLADGGGDTLVDRLSSHLALVLQKAGDLDRARELYERALAAARQRQDLPRELLRLGNLGSLQQELGDFDAAFSCYRETERLAKLIEGERERLRAALNRLNLLGLLGAGDTHIDECSEALDCARRHGLASESFYLALVLAQAALQAGSPERASRALGDTATPTDTAARAELESVQAEIALFQRSYDSAAQFANQAVALADEVGRGRIKAQALFWRGLASMRGTKEPETLDPASRQRAFVDLEESAKLASLANDLDLAWQCHAAANVAAAPDSPEAHFHQQKAKGIAVAAINRLGDDFVDAYPHVWHRATLWPLGVKTTATGIGNHTEEGSPASTQPSTGTPIGPDIERLVAINRQLGRDHDPERLLGRIIDAAIGLSGAERGFVVLVDEDSEPLAGEKNGSPAPDDTAWQNRLEVRMARGAEDDTTKADELDFSRSIAAAAIAQGRTINTLDASGDPRFEAFKSVQGLQIRSVLCLPMSSPPRVRGALYLDHRHKQSAFAQANTWLLEAFADQAAMALGSARLVAELRIERQEAEKRGGTIEDLNSRLEQELQLKARELELARRQRQVKASGDDDDISRDGIIGQSGKLLRIFQVIDRVAAADVPVTILGESGTGKELVARALHRASGADGDFVSVNCGAVAENLWESELFGHERGAFTGAVRRRQGLFELGNGGTVFLDEVGEMPLPVQVKLLRVLQQREYRRVGGNDVLTTDARVVCATNRDLRAAVQNGGFREDLWYRLNVVELDLPPLRDRKDDLPLLIEHFLQGQKLSRLALGALLDYHWPGNIRELENELRRATVLCAGDEIIVDDLSGRITAKSHKKTLPRTTTGTLKEQLAVVESELIKSCLETHQGNVTQTAGSLGLTRAGLYKKLNKYELKRDG